MSLQSESFPKLIQTRASNYFHRVDSLRWDAYMDECLQILAEQKEYPTDLILVQHVRLQLIVEGVAQAPWNDGQTDGNRTIRVRSQFYLKALQERLREFKEQIPPELVQNRR